MVFINGEYAGHIMIGTFDTIVEWHIRRLIPRRRCYWARNLCHMKFIGDGNYHDTILLACPD
jgi:hypothetical protein